MGALIGQEKVKVLARNTKKRKKKGGVGLPTMYSSCLPHAFVIEFVLLSAGKHLPFHVCKGSSFPLLKTLGYGLNGY